MGTPKSEHSPLQIITNKLTRLNDETFSWFVDGGDLDKTGENTVASKDLVRKKRLCSTIHHFKDWERDGIVILGID